MLDVEICTDNATSNPCSDLNVWEIRYGCFSIATLKVARCVVNAERSQTNAQPAEPIGTLTVQRSTRNLQRSPGLAERIVFHRRKPDIPERDCAADKGCGDEKVSRKTTRLREMQTPN
ncbi:MAG: hypothetical protein QHJ82_09055 [Verrucomicrobiota bacterium]|nr:hypothetical protein [Verrucomicrobiota bacterium]